MSLWEQWWPWIRQQRALLRELMLMLLAMLVVGVFFLEHFSARLEQERKVQLHALAEQTAHRAAEALASGDSISINLIGRETVQLAPVAGIRFADPEQVSRGQLGVPDSGLSVTVPVALPDGELAGTLTLLGEQSLLPRQQIESGYVLVVLCLLLLRLAVALVQQRLLPGRADEPPVVIEANDGDHQQAAQFPFPAAAPVADDAPLQAQLRLSIVNFAHLRERYTQTVLDEVLAEYQQLLERVALLYGARSGAPVGEQAGLYFYQGPASRGAFSALCAGLLFLRVVRLLAPLRKQQGKITLEFKALVTISADQDEAWALCVAGVPGRLKVPEQELAETELDVKALYQPEKAQVVSAGSQQVRLQPVEQLAHRYQTLLKTQAETLLSELGGEPEPSR